jgi:transmembrane sensor
MPADRSLSGAEIRPAPGPPGGPTLERRVLREAAVWLMRLRGEDATDADQAACRVWRAAHADHERAWARAEEVNRRFGLVPQALGRRALDRPASRERRQGIKTLALLIATAPAGWLAWRSGAWQEWAADQRTAIGEQRDIRLADGTRVVLDSATAIDLDFDAEQRMVRLDAGRMLVETAPDPIAAGRASARPFVVHTDQGRVRALGTRFTVRQESGATRVAVLDGALELRLHAAPQAVRLVPAGRQLRFTAAALGEPEPLAENADAWSRGVLIASRTRLADFSAELGRYRHGVLRCEAEVADLRISGAFQLADTDLVLSAVAATLPVAIAYRTRYWVTLTAPA